MAFTIASTAEDIQLFKYVLYVFGDRSLAHIELRGDFFEPDAVGQPFSVAHAAP